MQRVFHFLVTLVVIVQVSCDSSPDPVPEPQLVWQEEFDVDGAEIVLPRAANEDMSEFHGARHDRSNFRRVRLPAAPGRTGATRSASGDLVSVSPRRVAEGRGACGQRVASRPST